MAIKQDKNSKMNGTYGDPESFVARALEEVRRSKRYATFVSVVSVDLSHVDNADEIENYGNYDEFMTSIRNLVRGSVRETDLLGNFDRHKIQILLIDTPREGASILAERLRKILRYFMCGNVRSPINWRVPIKEYYFPSSAGDDFSIQRFLDQISEG
jgi:GGDEF domain-containing protein